MDADVVSAVGSQPRSPSWIRVQPLIEKAIQVIPAGRREFSEIGAAFVH